MQLDPLTSTTHPCATVLPWPSDSKIRYLFNRPLLVSRVDRLFPMAFIVRRDGYPVAGTLWTKITISLVNMGWLCRSLANVWAVGLAYCDDKQMPIMGIL